MLPKEEKIKKKADPEQQGLFDKENEKDRIAKKRKFIYIAMILTIGLSLSFKIYHSIKNTPFSFPKLPSFNFTVSSSKTNALDLPKDQNSTWSIFLKRIDSNSIIYQQNQDILLNDQDLEPNLNKLDQSSFIVKSNSFSSYLPEGVKVKEFIEEKDNSFIYFSKIIIPNRELLLIIKINNSKDITQSKKLLPDSIDRLYWYSLQK